jgi:hypothetical protein
MGYPRKQENHANFAMLEVRLSAQLFSAFRHSKVITSRISRLIFPGIVTQSEEHLG